MELHTAILMLVAVASIPVFIAYWIASRNTVRGHLEVLCASDQGTSTNSQLIAWKNSEQFRMVWAVALLVLLIVWGAVQVTVGPDGKSTLDWVLTLVFALPMVASVVVATHYDISDLMNSYGLGQRAERRITAH